jgi:hypothetical protein
MVTESAHWPTSLEKWFWASSSTFEPGERFLKVLQQWVMPFTTKSMVEGLSSGESFFDIFSSSLN